MVYPVQTQSPFVIEPDRVASPSLPLAGVEHPPATAEREKVSDTVRSLLDDQLLDQLVARMRSEGTRLTGPGGFLTEMLKAVLERGLAAELTDHLGYDKHDPAGNGSGNSRNGSTSKTLLTEVGPVPLDVPRDRAGTFTPQLVPKGERRLGGLSDIIISLYAGGMTVRDICHHLHRVYGSDLSPDTISTVTDAVLEEVKAWQTRPLDECYPVIFVDALMVKVRDGNAVRNKAAHLVVGVDTDGVKHVLGIWLQNSEGAKFWMQVFAELRNRGVRRVLIACCDGLEALPEAIETIWPYTIVQTCVVHLIRNSLKYASYTDRKKLATALRPLYTAVNADAAESALLELADSPLGRKYKAAIAVWERAWERFTPFLEFPPDLRKVIYTTNTIESLNFQLRKIIKNRGHFPTDDAVVKLLWLAICDIEDKRARAREADRGKPAGERTAPARLIEGSITTGWRSALAALDEFCQTRNLDPIH
ncbi:IS256 family transposase [Luedemannella helvata]|uniref:IS256 family transposase n=2 Tax=Luedemannella helvata TaxID=349315 RepID=A0ABN2K478_9ACTN